MHAAAEVCKTASVPWGVHDQEKLAVAARAECLHIYNKDARLRQTSLSAMPYFQRVCSDPRGDSAAADFVSDSDVRAGASRLL